MSLIWASRICRSARAFVYILVNGKCIPGPASSNELSSRVVQFGRTVKQIAVFWSKHLPRALPLFETEALDQRLGQSRNQSKN